MKVREKIELTLIPFLAVAIGELGRLLPRELTTPELLVIVCVIWLVQGGVRDLWILRQMKSQPISAPPRKMTCMCLESSVGLTGLLVGVTLTFFEGARTICLSPRNWTLMGGAVLTAGFFLRDFVITWHPFGIRRDAGHHSIVFVWR